MTDPLAEVVARSLQSLSDDSFHLLRGLGEAGCRELSKHFYSTTNPERRAFIVNVLWNTPCGCHDVYKEALRDMNKEVWNEAINALVSPASDATLKILKDEQEYLMTTEPSSQKLRYINEAIESFFKR